MNKPVIKDSSILERKNDPDAFRSAVRTWLADNAPSHGWQARLEEGDLNDLVAFEKAWMKKLATVGLAAPHWPKTWGGVDLSTTQQIIICEEMARAAAPDLTLYAISLNHVPATLYDWGTREQIEKYMPGVLDGVIWCQGFSEPNAGSDLASLRTRATKTGDVYVVNGQKIWSSCASEAEHCLLLARTDPDAPKHKGISYFILDMDTPGVDVRPIRQSNGRSEFCEIFLDNVEIPAGNLIGEENNGWLIAQSTLSAERGILIFKEAERLQYFFEEMLQRARDNDEAWIRDSELRRDFTRVYTEMQSVRIMIRQMLEEADRTGHVGDNPPFVKILYTEMRQRFAGLRLRILGLEGQGQTVSGLTTNQFHHGKPMYDFLSTWGWTIAGGTNQVMRNIIAERLIGLPKEPRPA